METLKMTDEIFNWLNHDRFGIAKKQNWEKSSNEWEKVTGLPMDLRWETKIDAEGTLYKLRIVKYQNTEDNSVYAYLSKFYRTDKKPMTKEMEMFRGDLNVFRDKDGIEYYYQMQADTNFYHKPYDEILSMFGLDNKLIDLEKAITISELCKFSNEMAKEKGFWDDYNRILKKLSDDTINMQYFKSLQMSQKLMLVVSELGESMESLRHLKFASLNYQQQQTLADLVNAGELDTYKELFKDLVKDSVEDELADAFIRLGDLCKQFHIDIETHIKLKHAFNGTREKMHGKKF